MSQTGMFALLGAMLVLGFLANRAFQITRVPDPIVLMIAGVLAGPVLHLVGENAFQPVINVFGTLALLLVLFEGGLELNVRETMRHFPGGFVLAFLGFVMSAGMVALVARFAITGMGWSGALLIGAVLGCTSSTVVLPILQQVRVHDSTRVVLLVESSLADVIAVVGVGILVDVTSLGGALLGSLLGGFLSKVLISLVTGGVAGFLWSRVLPRLLRARFWYVLTFGAVLLVYAGTRSIGGSGLIAVLCFGVTLGNIRPVTRTLADAAASERLSKEAYLQVLAFHSELGFLIRTFFFFVLGTLVQLADAELLVAALGMFAAIVVARALAVQASRWSWQVPREDRSLVFFMMPRGLVTAVLAVQVIEARGADFEWLSPIVFLIILLTSAVVVLGTWRASAAQAGLASTAPTL
ncbi:MAG TPA: cation:proton antiporter [Terriglobales bacterium]|nr:cation:proton antiporter [Terriglobales bacterium]